MESIRTEDGDSRNDLLKESWGEWNQRDPWPEQLWWAREYPIESNRIGAGENSSKSIQASTPASWE